ncbi:hypothetical protein L2E82_26769 [Cichorium intybus]|uniref:Uncharacterized protein n=1 Tax=Cichorium intybus TaxID=13427 RepID=A0ACB9CRS7_CICIN|nr:hypothetical protein L1887_20747 [Cichorium endivia]KAI3736782.1 hypothetical protein L2E82_26769 [Cichorium intybus]
MKIGFNPTAEQVRSFFCFVHRDANSYRHTEVRLSVFHSTRTIREPIYNNIETPFLIYSFFLQCRHMFHFLGFQT